MARIVWDVSVSLDGFTTGPNVGPETPMGEGGEALHAWLDATGPDAGTDRAQVEIINADLGAAIVGRRTYDLGLRFWGGTPWANTPCFVVTHRPEAGYAGANGGHFHFVSLTEAARRARETSGERNINVLGADVARQLLRAGEVDVLRLHTVPIVLGGGTPLFTGERVDLVPQSRPALGQVMHQSFAVERR
jgi:dihydrofolate reductase